MKDCPQSAMHTRIFLNPHFVTKFEIIHTTFGNTPLHLCQASFFLFVLLDLTKRPPDFAFKVLRLGLLRIGAGLPQQAAASTILVLAMLLFIAFGMAKMVACEKGPCDQGHSNHADLDIHTYHFLRRSLEVCLNCMQED